MADSTPKSYHTDPTLYLYTSLTAGSSHIITATSRLETILKANKIPFLALDVATDEKARMLWGRRAGKRKLPGLVRMGMIVGDLEEVEEWNEYGELKEHLSTGAIAPGTPTPSSAPSTPSKAPPVVETPTRVRFTAETPTKASQSAATGSPLAFAMRQAGFEAAKKASDAKSQTRAKVLGVAETSDNLVKKDDTSAAPGVRPPSGTARAAFTVAPETGSTSAKVTTNDTETDPKLTKELEPAGKGDLDAKPSTKPTKEQEPPGKEASDSDNVANSGSHALSEESDSVKPSDTRLDAERGGSGDGKSDSDVAASVATTNEEKSEIDDLNQVKAIGE